MALTGSHAFITGGSGGLGLAIAKNLAAKGAAITIADVKPGDDAVREIHEVQANQGHKKQAQPLTVDVANYDKVVEAVNHAEATYGPIDYLVANAGIFHKPGTVDVLDIDTVINVTNINFMGVVHTVKAALPGMMERRRGHILMISSILGAMGMYGCMPYSCAKAGVKAFADVLRLELLGSGVQVHVAQPNMIATPMTAALKDVKPVPFLSFWSKWVLKSMISADEAASKLVNGMHKGAYLIATNNFSSSLVINAQAGLVAPGVWSWPVDYLLAPLTASVKFLWRWELDRAVLGARKQGLIGDKPNGKSAKEE